MAKLIQISDAVDDALDTLKHPGQTYDGVLREILLNRDLDAAIKKALDDPKSK